MTLRRLISQVKRLDLGQFINLASRTYRTLPYARGGAHQLSSTTRTSTPGRLSNISSLSRRARETEGSNDPETIIRMFESQPSLHSNPSAVTRIWLSLTSSTEVSFLRRCTEKQGCDFRYTKCSYTHGE